MNEKTCIFCSIVRRQTTVVEIYEEADFIVLMDKYPVNVGHTLIVPKQHYDNLLSMSSEDVGRLYSLVSIVAKAVISAVKADGFNVGQNNGVAANQIIPHVHVHIIPRFHMESNSGTWPTRRVASHQELQEIAEKIKIFLIPFLNNDIARC